MGCKFTAFTSSTNLLRKVVFLTNFAGYFIIIDINIASVIAEKEGTSMISPDVIEHPVKMYIRRDIGMTVEQFGVLAGIPQPTLAAWIRRERRIEKLPMYFFTALGTITNKTIDETYHDLMRWQKKFDRYKQETLALVADHHSLFQAATIEGQSLRKSYLEKGEQVRLIEPAKQLRKALNEKNWLLFIKITMGLYSGIGRVVPLWLTNIMEDSAKLLEAGNAFSNELLS
jgi:hypothetical protein